MCAAQLLQLCPALCDLMDGSLPGTSVPGILQARILEWVAITSSWESSQPKNQTPCLLHLLHWQVGSLPQSPPGKPEIMHRQCQVHSFLFVCLFFKSLSRVQLFVTPWIVWNSPGQNTGVASLSLLQGIFQTQGSNPGLLHCRRILLPVEPQWSPKNTGVGNLSLLQGIFLTQESNQGLLHCRWILYQLSHQGSPLNLISTGIF